MEEIKLSEASIRFINYLRDPNASLYYTLGIDDVLTFLIKEATDYDRDNPEATYDKLEMLGFMNTVKQDFKELSKSE